MPHYTAIVTLLVVAFYFFVATQVAAAHIKFGVKLPAMSGQPDFERTYRVQMNMLEWMPTFLLPLWLSAIYFSDWASALVGLLWLVGRVVYSGLSRSGGEAAARLLHPGDGVHAAVHRRGHGYHHALVSGRALAGPARSVQTEAGP
jgi:glutathione S-transferase